MPGVRRQPEPPHGLLRVLVHAGAVQQSLPHKVLRVCVAQVGVCTAQVEVKGAKVEQAGVQQHQAQAEAGPEEPGNVDAMVLTTSTVLFFGGGGNCDLHYSAGGTT